MRALLVAMLILVVAAEAADAKHRKRERAEKPKPAAAKAAPAPRPPSSPPVAYEPLRPVIVRTVAMGLYFPAWQAEDRWPSPATESPEMLSGLLHHLSSAVFAPALASEQQPQPRIAAVQVSLLAQYGPVALIAVSFLVIAGSVRRTRRRAPYPRLPPLVPEVEAEPPPPIRPRPPAVRAPSAVISCRDPYA